MDLKNSDNQNLSNPLNEILVDKGYTFHLNRVQRWDSEILSLPLENRKQKPLYTKGSGLYGEYIHSGMVILNNFHYIAFERDNQLEGDKPHFKGFKSILIPIEECYYIIRKYRNGKTTDSTGL